MIASTAVRARAHRWRTTLAASVLASLVATGMLPAGQAQATLLPLTSVVMVQIDPAKMSRSQLIAAHGVSVTRDVLPSRGIYLVRPAKPAKTTAQLTVQMIALMTRMHLDKRIVRTEVATEADLSVSRFHGWPDGLPRDRTDESGAFDQQGEASTAALSCAREQSAASAVPARVTVLDTGVDETHPALLGGQVHEGYDYVDDRPGSPDVAAYAADGSPLDTDGDGIPNSAVGHGTFVAGLIHQLAPTAEITVAKVLDSDGYGNYYAVAQAIREATAARSDIISLSLSTLGRPTSPVLYDAVRQAQKQGILVVAAVGNTGSQALKYPAATSGVLSVGSLSATDTPTLSTFSDQGAWVRVAALGENVEGPLPGNEYGSWAGTSMSTALVAGQAAALFATKPGQKGADLYAAITGSAVPVPNAVLAHGAVNLEASAGLVVKGC